MAFLLYTLSNPETGEIRYVGQTWGDLSTRLTRHRSDARRLTRHLYAWWNGVVRDTGAEPKIELLEECSGKDDLDCAEMFWIANLRSVGARIVNISDGGGHLDKLPLSLETREKISMALKGRKFSAEHKARIGQKSRGRRQKPESIELGRQKRLGRKASLETRQKQSIARIGRLVTPETRELMRQKMLGRKFSPETLQRMSVAQKAVNRVITPEQRKRMTEGVRLYWKLKRETSPNL